MYNEYFGLTDTPFSIAPDPRYLYMSDQHREALAHLVFGMSTGGGFILLTGEVGTGKTTVCRCLLEQVPEEANVALILNPKVKAYELLATICDELGIEYPEGEVSIKALVDRINRYLLDEYARGRKTVVILEEAQNLDADVLEQLRLLTNLETNEHKLLQIVMLGQPELLEMLASPKMSQLSQRITARYHLKALSRKEADEYVNHRLSVAGMHRVLFPESILGLLYRLSGGIPRRINLLCDRALLGVYVSNRNQVDIGILKKAAKEVMGEEHPSFASRIRKTPLWWLVGSVALTFVVAFSFGSISFQDISESSKAPSNIAVEKRKSQPVNLVTTASQKEKSGVVEKQAAMPDMQVSYKGKIKKLAVIKQDVSSLHEYIPEGSSTASTLRKAYVSLLKLWKIALPENIIDLCEQVRSKGLGCLFRKGDMKSIIHMNRPAALKLFDTSGQAFYVAFVKHQDGVATIIIENKEYKVRVSDLEENWPGGYALIWRLPPGSHDGAINPGDKGPHVLWLATRLAQTQGEVLDTKKSDEFNAFLTEKIKAFQRSRGLLSDGLAKPVTLIHLNSIADPDIPLLKFQ